MSQKDHWDAATRKVVEDRLNKIPSFRFFAPDPARLLEAVCARLLPQDDRDAARLIPLASGIDDRLFRNEHNGYRYENMPPDREAYELGLKGIDAIARHLHGRGFADLDTAAQDEILASLHAGKPAAGHDIWQRLPVHRFFLLVLQDCIDQYYSHPWAWDEIGFGGPAYPRAYMRLERGEAEPWEKPEQRREWSSPGSSISEKFSLLAGLAEHLGGPQGGTH